MRIALDEYAKKYPYELLGYWGVDEELTEVELAFKNSALEDYKGLTLELAQDIWELPIMARRPYYRLRGKRVSKEQAKEVLRLTDQFFVELIGSMARNEEIDYSLERSLFEEQFLWVDHFCNWIFQNNHSPKYMDGCGQMEWWGEMD